jgi:molybdopterin/thiamine biosynthesis adenylyltransferase
VGQSKAAASAAELRNIAQDFELVVYEQGFTEEMAEEFVEGCDAIVGEIDVSVLDKYVVLHRAAIKRNIPIYSSYVVGLGIHFFKFHGAQYTFEDFMGVPEAKWRKPDLDLIFKLFGEPYPSYLNEKQIQNYKGEAARDGIPIFGPATLLGHNLVTTRMILDLMRNQMQIGQFPETPTMPEFLVLDPVDLTFKVERIKE